jgi:adenosylcobinamide-GDP ribazoletransferase
VVAALLLGALCLVFSFGLTGAVIAFLMLAVVGFLLARIATKQFGGQTGDVLRAMEQLGEAAILLIAASLF